ncbi:MAG: Bax inhibitor-1/YccA family protein [Rickettsiales bacterium]|jgi:FtsH-binding integral membrane protein|nr:Bax inhibitor-1/YccA family protein [Rickettsiales bacterium]
MAAKTGKTNKTDISSYFKKVFLTMAAAVGTTALTVWLSLTSLANVVWPLILNETGTGFSAAYYILVFGGLGLIVYAQARIFSLSQMAAIAFLFVYSVLMGITMMPLIAAALSIDPAMILRAFLLSALMLASMAAFGYRTEKDLSFLRVFLLAGMIGLILVGVSSIFVPFGSGFAMAVSAIGVLVFALFTAYDMQSLKRIFGAAGLSPDDADKFVVMGAIHMYISFVAMFQYLLSLMSLSRN